MGIIGKDFKYKIVDNFLSKDEIEILSIYTNIKHRINATNFDFQMSMKGESCYYGDPATEALMVKKLKLMEKETGRKLHPTYSYWRMYTMFSDLKKHKDREACEISVTVCVSSDGTPWPIYMDGQPIDLKPGQAAIYLGIELEHWRNEFKGDFQAQAFLHYVDAEGPYKNFVLDGRKILGQ